MVLDPGDQPGKVADHLPDRNSTMNDVSENSQGFRFVERAEFRKAFDEGIFACEWKHLTAEAMGPCIAEVEIDHAENLFVLQVNGAAGVQPDSRLDFKA